MKKQNYTANEFSGKIRCSFLIKLKQKSLELAFYVVSKSLIF